VFILVKDIEIEEKINEENLEDDSLEIEDEEDVPKVRKLRKNRRQRRLKDEIVHDFIPSHIIATEKDLAELTLKNISVEKLPLISISDAAIRHLEVKAGDVIKIKRKNEIIGDIYYYRRVITDE
jgi:DNA-directed RNA polymerase subunit H (RpoH/RPB5)